MENLLSCTPTPKFVQTIFSLQPYKHEAGSVVFTKVTKWYILKINLFRLKAEGSLHKLPVCARVLYARVRGYAYTLIVRDVLRFVFFCSSLQSAISCLPFTTPCLGFSTPCLAFGHATNPLLRISNLVFGIAYHVNRLRRQGGCLQSE